MSRTLDAAMMANQVLHIAQHTAPTDRELPDAVISAFHRCADGLTEYERDKVASVVNFLMGKRLI